MIVLHLFSSIQSCLVGPPGSCSLALFGLPQALGHSHICLHLVPKRGHPALAAWRLQLADLVFACAHTVVHDAFLEQQRHKKASPLASGCSAGLRIRHHPCTRRRACSHQVTEPVVQVEREDGPSFSQGACCCINIRAILEIIPQQEELPQTKQEPLPLRCAWWVALCDFQSGIACCTQEGGQAKRQTAFYRALGDAAGSERRQPLTASLQDSE